MTEAVDAFEEILLYRLSRPQGPEMSLDDYHRWIEGVTPPTDSQIEDFADYVASARSWYKHLPLKPPGSDFHFYIDRHAGVDRLINRSNEVHFRRRTQNTASFHYSWMTTAEYRERFGCLAFSCAAGPALFMDDYLGDYSLIIDDDNYFPRELKPAGEEDEAVLVDNNCHHPVLQIMCLAAKRPPTEVLAAGTCHLTALVHPRATEEFLIRRLAKIQRSQYKRYGPSGEALDLALKRLQDKEVRANLLDEQVNKVGSDPVFVALIQQEKARLRQNMIEAMQHMRQIAFPGFTAFH
jgi:hypothetical protein